MGFRFKVRGQGVLREEGNPVPVLVVAQVTEKSFAGTHLSYKVVDEDGCQFLVDEEQLEKPGDDDEDTGGGEEVEESTGGEGEAE